MAWLETRKRRDGRRTYWIRDKRDGQQIVIFVDAASEGEARMKLAQYEIRRDLEKEGYPDRYDVLDRIEGDRVESDDMEPFRKADLN